MTRIIWDSIADRVIEMGVDRGVLYVDGSDGVAWNGLTGITEKPSGGTSTPYYIDGEKFIQTSSSEDFSATIAAITYPDEFDACEGVGQYNAGLFLTGQPRKSFGISYRTQIADPAMAASAYKIHIVYNAMVNPTNRGNTTLSATPAPLAFSWDVETVPVEAPGFKSSAHFVIDSRTIRGAALSAIEDILYGDDSDAPRMPTVSEMSLIIDSFADLQVTINGDGTATISGVGVTMIDANTYSIYWPSVIEIDANTYSITSS